MHGFLDSADAWVIGQPKAIAFSLVDKGFDVWLGNNRGNKYSLKHKILDSSADKNYWHFSFEAMGDHDSLSIADYIIQKTERKKITYIGHGQATS